VRRLKKLIGRTRIIYRGWFLGGRNAAGKSIVYYDGDERLSGKDWLHLADDEELLELSLKSIDNQIDLLLQTLGKNSIYAVSIGEEEPDAGMGFGRGPAFFNQDIGTNTKKIIKVNNLIYKHLKTRYPKIKVAISYYPYFLPDWAYKELKYDCIVMDSYPSDLKDLERHLEKWQNIYPLSKEVYLILKGDGEVLFPKGFEILGYSLMPRQKEIAFLRKVFNSFYDAGYRNIGFLGCIAMHRCYQQYFPGLIN